MRSIEIRIGEITRQGETGSRIDDRRTWRVGPVRLLGNLLVRSLAILFGYVLAVAAAALFLAFGYYREIFGGTLEYGDEFIIFDTVSISAVTLYLMFIITWLALLPAALLIAVCELMRWSSITAHLVLGALCALFTAFGMNRELDMAAVQNSTLVILLACGFIGGFVYWLIADAPRAARARRHHGGARERAQGMPAVRQAHPACRLPAPQRPPVPGYGRNPFRA